MSFFGNLFKSKSNTTTLEPMLTPEQQQAMSLLMNYGTTGNYNGFQAGQAYDGSLGDFSMTPTENAANSNLFGLLMNNGGYNTSKKALEDLSSTTFNPDDPSSGFAAYSRQVARSTKAADDVLNRNAAIGGSRYGSRIGADKANLAAQQSDMLGTKLADLFNTSQDRKLNAANSLESLNQSRVGMGFQYGGLQRELNDLESQRKYNDFIRQRNERLGSIESLNNVFNRNIDYGMKSMTTKSPSTFMSMYGELNPFVGSYNTHKYGYTTNQTSLADLMKLAMSGMKTGATGSPGIAGGSY